MPTVWDNQHFADAWNNTYGIDMAKAPIRPGVVFPLICNRVGWNEANAIEPRLVDFGCGNGNLIRALKDHPFKEWVGIDSGSAILDTASPLAEDTRISFMHADISEDLSHKIGTNFDHATSVFTLEEIPVQGVPNLFNNMASAVSARAGSVHIFTQHPAYALQQDLLALEHRESNKKFIGNQGYFDTEKSFYNLSVLNAQQGFPEQAEYHHKPLGLIINGLAKAGLCLDEMLEVPAGIIKLAEVEAHTPKSGDVPRFLYLRASYKP